jgi:hypothetical protein
MLFAQRLPLGEGENIRLLYLSAVLLAVLRAVLILVCQLKVRNTG